MSINDLMRGRTISLKGFDEFVSLCNRQDGESLLVAVQASMPASQHTKQKFVAFHVGSLEKENKGTYFLRPENYVFDGNVRDGRIEYKGDSTFPMLGQRYPEPIDECRFSRGEVVVLDPSSDLGVYILASLEGGRLRAEARLLELGIQPTFLQLEPS